MARRKAGTLVPLEEEILAVALEGHDAEAPTFHGFALAQQLRERGGSRSLAAHGTLYKALGRLEGFGLLSSTWEDVAEADGRPRRRLYQLTGDGIRAARAARPASATAIRPRPRLA